MVHSNVQVQVGINHMKKQKNWTFMIVTMISIFFIISTTGCDRHTRYKVLTFFFTGVPPIDGTASEEVTDNTTLEKKEKTPGPVAVFIHGPYASEQCDLCHVVQSDKPKTAEKYAGGFPRLQDLPSALLLPKNEICTECHDTKDYQSAYKEDLWIHGPVSSGMCTNCHHHHASQHNYMLLKEKTVDLCSQCHTGGFILDSTEHTEDKDCIECHNAHVGKDRFLLKKDYVEIY